MHGAREFFTCPACAKRFTYWVQGAAEHPKVACYYCKKEFFPKGEPPASEAPPAPAAPAAKPAAAPPKTPEPVKAS